MSKAVNTGNGYPSGMKNRIINGGMDISQRGTSFAAVVNGTYTLDRWSYAQSNDASITITQNSDVPSNNEFQNSLRVTVNTADASIASGQYGFLQQTIEGYNIRDLIGRTFTVSFWARSTKTGIHCATVKNSSLDRCYVAEYTINTTNTWEYKTITVSGGLPTAGTWNYTNVAGLLVNFTLAAGSTLQGSVGWNTTSVIATSNQVNCLDSSAGPNIFAITGVQLELGPVATPFEHRPFGAELALCQRYFQKSYHIIDAPGTVIGSALRYQASGTAGESAPCVVYPVTMRTTPIYVIYSDVTGASGQKRNYTASADTAMTGFNINTSNGHAGSNTGHTAGSIYGYHYTVSAEL